MTPGQVFYFMDLIFKGEYYLIRCILCCQTADNLFT